MVGSIDATGYSHSAMELRNLLRLTGPAVTNMPPAKSAQLQAEKIDWKMHRSDLFKYTVRRSG